MGIHRQSYPCFTQLLLSLEAGAFSLALPVTVFWLFADNNMRIAHCGKYRLRGETSTRIERLRDALSAQPRQQTEIIDIFFIDPSTEDAKLLVDTVLDQYMRYVGEMSDSTEDKLYRQLVDQYKSLENEILGRERISAELRRSLRTTAPQELVAGQRVRLDETQARLSELRQSIAVLEWEAKQANVDDSNMGSGMVFLLRTRIGEGDKNQ